MSEQKTDPIPWEADPATKPSFFQMKAQLLDSGNTETPLCVGDHLWLKIKVYAKGGENQLHAHPYQDHSFIVLSGRARFHGPRGEVKELAPGEGIFLPKGSFYRFETISEDPLVLLRAGAAMAAREDQERLHPDTRIMPDGSWQVRRGRAETFVSKDVSYRDGDFYE